MDPSIYNENNNNLKLCFEAELKLRTLPSNAANAQELKDSQLLHQAHAAIADIWNKALTGPIESSVEWDACRRSVNHSINLIAAMAQQLDADKFDLQELKTPDNIHHLFVALKTLEIAKLKLQTYDQEWYYHLDRMALNQLKLMLNGAFCLLQTTYDLLKA